MTIETVTPQPGLANIGDVLLTECLARLADRGEYFWASAERVLLEAVVEECLRRYPEDRAEYQEMLELSGETFRPYDVLAMMSERVYGSAIAA